MQSRYGIIACPNASGSARSHNPTRLPLLASHTLVSPDIATNPHSPCSISSMHFLSFLILTTSTLLSHAASISSVPPVLHLTLSRRGGAFPTENVANLTFLAEELEKAEARFNLTRREVRGNKLVRKAKERDVGGKEEGRLMGSLGLDGRWY